MLMKHNELVQMFRNAFDLSKTQGPIPTVSIMLQNDVKGVPKRTYNVPTANQVAAIVPTNDPERSRRSVTIQFKAGQSVRIYERNPLYEALQYPLFYVYATPSWPAGVKETSKHHPTQQKYYCYRLMSRQNSLNIPLRSSRLTQQWTVDMYSKVLQYKLHWVRNKQEELR